MHFENSNLTYQPLYCHSSFVLMNNVLVLLNAVTESIKRSESTQIYFSCLVVASGCI